MKKIFLGTLVLFLAVSVFAQQQNDVKTPAQVKTDAMVEKYNLSEKQEAAMLKVITRMMRNETEITSLKTTEPNSYFDKMKANESGTNFSVRRILNEDQTKLFDKAQLELRTKRANKTLEMEKQGKTPQEIKEALLEFKW